MSWREIAIQYHLRKLRANAGYFSEIVEDPEESPTKDALRRFVATPDGSVALCRTLVLETLELVRLRPDGVFSTNDHSPKARGRGANCLVGREAVSAIRLVKRSVTRERPDLAYLPVCRKKRGSVSGFALQKQGRTRY